MKGVLEVHGSDCRCRSARALREVAVRESKRVPGAAWRNALRREFRRRPFSIAIELCIVHHRPFERGGGHLPGVDVVAHAGQVSAASTLHRLAKLFDRPGQLPPLRGLVATGDRNRDQGALPHADVVIHLRSIQRQKLHWARLRAQDLVPEAHAIAGNGVPYDLPHAGSAAARVVHVPVAVVEGALVEDPAPEASAAVGVDQPRDRGKFVATCVDARSISLAPIDPVLVDCRLVHSTHQLGNSGGQLLVWIYVRDFGEPDLIGGDLGHLETQHVRRRLA
mmetsp:Transcript_129025/g.413355  ORF Transcript_129025/g.413355 Transcript_129025/m.413355 type:complete len:279 (+) Transcript_129025:10670-11506(+)